MYVGLIVFTTALVPLEYFFPSKNFIKLLCESDPGHITHIQFFTLHAGYSFAIHMSVFIIMIIIKLL